MARIIKKLFLVLGMLLLAIILLLFILISENMITSSLRSHKNMARAGKPVQVITVDGLRFRDLNKNDSLDIYEDFRQPKEKRVDDLLARMTLEEKAGLMFNSQISIVKNGNLQETPRLRDPFSFTNPGTSTMLFVKNMNHFNIAFGMSKTQMAEWYNRLQKLAERTRLGIPVTIASDPRNQISTYLMASALSGDFSLWPEPLGLAAIGDSVLVARFADIVRQEYLAVGIRVALHPMADLATEPRWSRINGTFGEDAALASKLLYAYIKGLQRDTLSSTSVACMAKHFPSGGPQKEGIDPHFPVTKGQVYPGNNFDYHLLPFNAVFKAGVAEIMPYYGAPKGLSFEEVGFNFNKTIIQDLLRKKFRFDGVICTDWGILTDLRLFGINVLPARARGMERATPKERMLKAIEAGVDQFGGEMLPEMLIKLVREGTISEERIDSSARRLLRVKFALGLFDNPFVDVQQAEHIVGNPEFKKEGEIAQRKSFVLLKNDMTGGKPTLPLKEGIKIYIKGIDPIVASKYCEVVKKPEEAEYAIIRLQTPTEYIRGTGILGRYFSSGDLDFKGRERSEILNLLNEVPTIVDIELNRAAVIPEISKASRCLLANFGASDEALIDVIFGKFKPQGKLPIELPSSMEAVRNQKEDVPYDSKNPLYKYGYGLTY
jgi:beta-glucosidase